MCHSKSLTVLAESPRGYIGQCTGCHHITVAYGNIFLVMQASEYRDFCRVIQEKLGIRCYEMPLPNGKQVLIPTPVSGVLFALSDAEFEELGFMIDRARCVNEMRQNLFDISLN
jgi:hypothetical protein